MLEVKNECFNSHWAIIAEIEGRNLFRQTFIDRSFDDLLLVDEKGNVLFQLGESGLQFNRANLLFAGDIGASDLGSELSKSSPAGQSTGKGADGLEFQIHVERKDDTTFFKKVPTRQEVTVGGKSMYVFALPLNLPAINKEQKTLEGNPEGNRSYILLGLVSKDKLRNETWQLSPSVLLILLLIAVLTLLVLPLLKLFSMGSQDQWSLRDLTLVVGAGIIGTGLLTLALVDAGAFWWTKEQVDDELGEFADAMVKHTHEEISEAITQLNIFDEIRDTKLEEDKQKTENKLAGAMRWKELNDFRSLEKEMKEGTGCHEMKQNLTPAYAMLNVLQMDEIKRLGPSLKTFDSVFWVDCAGRLVAQWDARTKDDYFPPIVTNLSDRPYFADVINQRYLHMHVNGIDKPFTIQPLFSRIDGSNNVVIAIRSRINLSDKPEAAIVAGLESRFLSLFDPIVPPGLGYAVVDGSNGKVLFHSQGQRNLREKFFEETDNNMKLKALITSRAQGCEYGTYGGNSHRFCVREFRDIPWALVVFKNMEPLRTANLEAVTVASILFMIYASAVLGVVIAGISGYKVKIGRQGLPEVLPAWLWPSKERHAQYVASALVTLVLLLVGLLSLWWLPPQYAFVTGVILLPIIGAFVAYTLLNRESLLTSCTSPGAIVDYRQAYIVVCGTMLALCSVLPSAVCMTLSYESEQTLLLKAGVLDLAKSFSKSADLIRERYQYQEDQTLIPGRLYENKREYSDSQTPLWCPRRLDNSARRDVHLWSGKKGSEWLTDFTVCLEVKDRAVNVRSGLPRDNAEDWFEEIYRFIRVPYNDEFTRAQGLFSQIQQSEDVQWYVPGYGTRMVSYRPVHDLKRLDKADHTGSQERWNVAVTIRPWLIRLPSIILLVCTIGGVLLVCRKLLKIHVLLRIAIGIAAMPIILKWPGETLLGISVLLLLLFFAWLIYVLPSFVARRVLLLDLVPLDRSVYVNKLRESPNFSTFTEDEKKAFGPFEEEFGASEQLCKIGKDLIEQWDLEKREHFQSEVTSKSLGFDPNAVALFLCDTARFRYKDVWAAMSNEEKMALLHLARSGFIHKDHPGLISLFKKGWILCSPQLRYVNESFRQFVLSHKEEVLILQSQLSGGTWGQLVGPLGFGMVFILAGLMYTQQELLTGVTALVGVLAGLVPVISKVFDLFKSQKAGSSAS